MRKRYGCPYAGSKNFIAEWVCDTLPSGNRLVDLFGGGGSITHWAIEHCGNKWNKFLYNDHDKRAVDLVSRAISGDYTYEWVDRKTFHKLKDTDGVVAYCWSFGNNGSSYLYGENIEDKKRQLHNYIVNNDLEINSNLLKDINFEFKSCDTIEDRKDEYRRFKKTFYRDAKLICDVDLLKVDTGVQSLRALERLHGLQCLRRLQELEITNHSYLDYVYEEGDIVYCDIPYENCTIRKGIYSDGSFDHNEFYKWAKTRSYPVYFSSYEVSDNSFEIVGVKFKTQYLSSHSRNVKNETIYWNRR